VTVVHGRCDETVDWRESLRYAEQATHVDLHLVDDDHALASPRAESLLRWCARELMSRSAAAEHAHEGPQTPEAGHDGHEGTRSSRSRGVVEPVWD